MKCPSCGYPESKVIDSRPNDENIRRRRECEQCQKRFTTYEYIETVPVMVIKKDLRREPFSRDKIYKSILIACGKQPISAEKIEMIVNNTVAWVESNMRQEISSRKIGEFVMEELRSVDLVAFIRFASVYLNFNDIRDVRNVVDKIENKEM